MFARRGALYDDRQTCVVGRDSSVMETRAAIASVATRGAWGVFCTTSIYIGRVSTSVRTKSSMYRSTCIF